MVGEDPSSGGTEAFGMLFSLADIFLFVPLGFILLIAAGVFRRRRSRQGFVDEAAGEPRQGVEGGCLASAVPLAAIGFLWFLAVASVTDLGAARPTGLHGAVLEVELSLHRFTEQLGLSLVAVAPSVAAFVIAVRDRLDTRRSGSLPLWDLAALAAATMTLFLVGMTFGSLVVVPM